MIWPDDDIDDRFEHWRDEQVCDQATREQRERRLDDALTDLHKRGVRQACGRCGYLWMESKWSSCPRCDSRKFTEDR